MPAIDEVTLDAVIRRRWVLLFLARAHGVDALRDRPEIRAMHSAIAVGYHEAIQRSAAIAGR